VPEMRLDLGGSGRGVNGGVSWGRTIGVLFSMEGS